MFRLLSVHGSSALGGSGVTSDQQRQFEHMWPALALRLQRLLRRKKVAPWLQEDVVQETGLRLIRMWEQVDQTKPLWPLTATIGLNLLRDEIRKSGWSDLVQAVPDAPSVENVERRSLARLELRAVGRSLKRMPVSHRDVLLAEMSDDAPGAPDPSATRMLRMRARRKLQHLLDQASVLGLAAGTQLRRVARAAELLLGRAIPERAEALATAAVGLLAALSIGTLLPPDASPPPAKAGRSSSRSVVGGTASTGADVVEAASGRRAAAKAALASDRRTGAEGRSEDEAKRITDAGPGSAGSGDSFPGARSYGVEITEDTYIQGEVEIEVVGGTDIDRATSGRPPRPGSVDCTVAPGESGASCTHTSEESRGVRARHRGEAYVGGKRIY